MNCLNENNKEAKIYGQNNENCEGLESHDISVWSNQGKIGLGIEGLLYLSM